jgi:hypothetical protein
VLGTADIRHGWSWTARYGRSRRLLHIIGVVLLAMTLVGTGYLPVAHADAAATVDAALNTLWNTYGNQGGHWTGGDGTISVALPDGRIVWLYSDTFLGTVNGDHSRPSNAPLIHNCMVVQQGNTLTTITGGTASAPTALVQAATNSGTDWDWVDSALLANNNTQLDVFYTQFHSVGSGPLSFQQMATAIAVFSLPSLSLQSVTQLNVGASLQWGAAVLDQADYTYVYGTEDVGGNKFLHLARAPHGQVLTAGNNPTAAWQFWTDGGWSAGESSSSRMISGVGNGFSVAKIGQQYVVITQDTGQVFSPNIVAYTATAPTGPFGNQTYLYKTPEAGGSIITYIPQLHAEFGSPGTLVLSYNVNSLEDGGDYADARIYRPRFIDITWPVAAPDPATLPAPPTSLSATSDHQGVHLSWTASTTSGVAYWVYLQDVTSGQTQASRLPTPITSGTSLDLVNLTNGDTYRFRVTAYTTAGESPPSNSVTAVPDLQAPTATPANLTATANSDGTIGLHWGAVSGVGIYYRVYQRDTTAGETDFSPWDAPVTNGTSATARSLAEGHQYEFAVSAANPAGEGPLSAAVTAVAHMLPPAAPTALRATANNDGTIALAWTAPGPDLWYWAYFRDVSAGQGTYTRTRYPVTSGTSLTLSYLTNGDTYAFEVTAINAGGEGAPSNPVSARPMPPLPQAPSGLHVILSESGANNITLRWTASPTPNVYYWIWLHDTSVRNSAWYHLPLPWPGAITSADIVYLTEFHTYNFAIQAVNAAGTSPYSNVVAATPWGDSFGYQAYSPPLRNAWDRISYPIEVNYGWGPENCDPLPAGDSTICAHWVEFESLGYEYYWAIRDATYYWSYLAGADKIRDEYCYAGVSPNSTVGCSSWSEWRSVTCRPAPIYSVAVGCWNGKTYRWTPSPAPPRPPAPFPGPVPMGPYPGPASW